MRFRYKQVSVLGSPFMEPRRRCRNRIKKLRLPERSAQRLAPRQLCKGHHTKDIGTARGAPPCIAAVTFNDSA